MTDTALATDADLDALNAVTIPGSFALEGESGARFVFADIDHAAELLAAAEAAGWTGHHGMKVA